MQGTTCLQSSSSWMPCPWKMRLTPHYNAVEPTCWHLSDKQKHDNLQKSETGMWFDCSPSNMNMTSRNLTGSQNCPFFSTKQAALPFRKMTVFCCHSLAQSQLLCHLKKNKERFLLSQPICEIVCLIICNPWRNHTKLWLAHSINSGFSWEAWSIFVDLWCSFALGSALWEVLFGIRDRQWHLATVQLLAANICLVVYH